MYSDDEVAREYASLDACWPDRHRISVVRQLDVSVKYFIDS